MTRAKDRSVCRNTTEALIRCCPKRRVDMSDGLTGLEKTKRQQVVNNLKLNKVSVHYPHPHTARGNRLTALGSDLAEGKALKRKPTKTDLKVYNIHLY